jgi:aerobic-type carbon monoxide dehydrogenase small subunit (CoxS/CutS family)
VQFTLNGAPVEVDAPPMKRLLDVLREECGLTGTKEGCGEGECGACTVLLDGAAVCSCLVPFAQISGTEVVAVLQFGRTDNPLAPGCARRTGRRFALPDRTRRL